MTERGAGGPGVGRKIDRDEVLDCAIRLIRAGEPSISRRQIAAMLGAELEAVATMFPRAFVIITEAIERRSRQIQGRFAAVLSAADLTPGQRLDRLQGMILSLYTSDAYVLELQTSLWREGHASHSVVRELKQVCKTLLSSLASVDTDIDLLTNALWGTCQHCSLSSMLIARRRIFDSEQLLIGRLVLLPTSDAWIA